MEAIEKRLSNIEAAVFGAGKTSSAPPDTDVVSKLLSVAKECGNAAGKRERIAPVMRRTAELAKYTDPGFAENYGGLSPAIKADIVLAQEEKLREMHRMLKQVEDKKQVLDASKDFENAAKLQPRLLELTKIQLDQDEAGRELSAETCSLVAEYNGLVETISKALIGYDQALTKAEAAAEANREKKRTS